MNKYHNSNYYENVHGIAYWNSTLFVVGNEKIYYSTMTLNGTDNNWKYFIYNNNSDDTIQYKSSLFILTANQLEYYHEFHDPRRGVNVTDSEWYYVTYYLYGVFHIDLNQQDHVEIISIPDYIYRFFTGVVWNAAFILSGENVVYIVVNTYILIYHFTNGHW